MKTLYLVRHAKSSWANGALGDRQRPLNDRGQRDAPKMGKRLAQRSVRPDLIVSSPAQRALTTAEIFAAKLDYPRSAIAVDDRLYAAAADELLDVIRRLDDRTGRAMLIGHNPGMTELAHRFSGSIAHLPTCAVAEFAFDVKSWEAIGTNRPASVALDFPKKA